MRVTADAVSERESVQPTSDGVPPAAHRGRPLVHPLARPLQTLVHWQLLVGLAVVTAFLLPARFAALRGDDTWVSEVRGEGRLGGMGMLEFLWAYSRNFVESGRPTFGGIVQGLGTAWLVGDHRVASKLLLVALTAAAAGVLYVLALRLGLGRTSALLVLVVLAGALQMRSYHDPLLGYWGTMQVLLILVLGSLILFERALERRSTRLLLLSVAVFLPALLLYEATFTLVPVFAAVALFKRRGRAALVPSSPFLALGGAFVLTSLYLRATAQFLPDGYEVGTSPIGALQTYVAQLLSPFPASNLLLRADHYSFFPLGAQPTHAELAASAWRGLLVFGLVLLVALRLTRSNGARLPRMNVLGRVAIVGVILWMTAGIALAMSPKYQEELVPGKNALPGLISVFGWALVAAAGVLALLHVAVRRGPVATWLVSVSAAAVIAAGASLTAFNNFRVVGLEAPVAQTRDLLEQAAADGIFDTMPEHGTIVFSHEDMYWWTGNLNQFPIALEAMLLNRTGRRFDGRIVEPEHRLDCPHPGDYPPPECATPSGEVAWVRVRARADGGSVLVARLPPGTQEPLSEATQTLRVYVWSAHGDPRPPLVVGKTTEGVAWTSDGVPWLTVESDGRRAIYHSRVPPLRAGTVDDADATFTFTTVESPEEAVRIFGARRLLP